MSKGMKPLDWVALVLVLAGALNWGLVGLFKLNLVQTLLTSAGVPWLERIVYIVVGVAGGYSVYSLAKN